MEHTEGKWFISEHRKETDDCPDAYEINSDIDSFEPNLLSVYGYHFEHSLGMVKNGEANARRICQCCNSHDEMYALIKQLEGCVVEAQELFKGQDIPEDWDRILKRADRLKQALTNAQVQA